MHHARRHAIILSSASWLAPNIPLGTASLAQRRSASGMQIRRI
jgi:hypothetical protein